MGRYCPHVTWVETLANREKALAKRHSREQEKWSEHTKALPVLTVGDNVYIQNLVGNHPRRRERTGVIVEVRQFHQYVVKIDGSGRLTLRNRQHLRKFIPFNQPRDAVIESLSPTTYGNEVPMKTQSCPKDPPIENLPEEPELLPAQNEPLHDKYVLVPEGATASPLDPSQVPPATPPTPNITKVSRALARLKSHNLPGEKESLPTEPVGRLRPRRN